MFADIREAPRSPACSGVSGMPGRLRLPRRTQDDRIGHRSAGRASARTNQWSAGRASHGLIAVVACSWSRDHPVRLAANNARSRTSLTCYVLIQEFGWSGIGHRGHGDDRAGSVTQTVMADGSDQEPAESNMLTGSHNQELRVT